jgi:hypothetical protein
MYQNDAIYLVSDHPSDFGRYSSQEYHILAAFLREEARSLTSYETLKAALAHQLGTSVDIWAMCGMTYIGVEMIAGTAVFPFVVPEWRRVYRLLALPEGTTGIAEGAEMITHWRSLPDDQRDQERQELTGRRRFEAD